MRIDHPAKTQVNALRQLWQEAFGDADAFLDLFFGSVFSPERCRCVTLNGEIAAALYWLDCRCEARPISYLYAVATAKAHRGRGICRALIADTHRLLREQGYAGVILCPGNEALFNMYAAMGYQVCAAIRELQCAAGEQKAELQAISPETFADMRKKILPPGSIVQEGTSLAFLSGLYRFYAGQDFLLCCDVKDGKLFAPELLGNADAAPGILAALDAGSGTFRTPGKGRDFAMYCPLSEAPAPSYFAFAFD